MPTVEVFTSADAPVGRLDLVHRLLTDAFGDGFSDDDWHHTLGGTHVTITGDDGLVAHAAAVPRLIMIGTGTFRAGYVEGVATRRDRHGQGHGTAAMTELARVLSVQFEIGILSTDRPRFYERLGWERWNGPTYVRTRRGLRRTPDEDDGIMVLRFGPSRGADRAQAIICEERAGDDW